MMLISNMASETTGINTILSGMLNLYSKNAEGRLSSFWYISPLACGTLNNFSSDPNRDPAYQCDTKRKQISQVEECSPPSALLVFHQVAKSNSH